MAGETAASLIAKMAVLELLWLRHDAKIRLWSFPSLRITSLRLFIGDRAGNDPVLAWLPVHWRSDLVFGRELQGINHSQHLIEISAGCHRVDKYQLNFFIRCDDVNTAHGRVICGRTLFRITCGIGREHAV